MAALLAGGASAQVDADIGAAAVRDRNASFVDVPARRQYLQSGTLDALLQAALPAEYDCLAAPVVAPDKGAMVIPGRYLSGGHGPLHPDYERVVALYRDFESVAARLGNLYVATGKPEYAVCLVEHLGRWADAGALLDYDPAQRSQAWYQTEWSASAASLALSTVMAEPAVDAARRQQVVQWLHRVVSHLISEPGERASCCNNHSNWRGLAATATGIISGDDSLFRWGLSRYAQGIGQIAADGSFPLEMERKEQSLHYQNFALQPLVLTAELARRQGVDLYNLKRNGRNLHVAVDFLFAGLANPAVIARYAPQKQDMRGFSAGRGDLAWMEFYRSRFPSTPHAVAIADLLAEPGFAPRTGGSAALLVHLPPH